MESANWNCLPSEIKCIIIGFMDRATRTSLKRCSHLDKELVDSCPLRVLHCCEIRFATGQHKSYIKSSNPVEEWDRDEDTKIEFDTVEELDAYFQCEIYNHYDRIEKCYLNSHMNFGVLLQSCPITFKFSHSNYNIKIADLHMNNLIIEEMMILLKQVDPYFLETLVINSNSLRSELYDMPQVINAKRLVAVPNLMTGEQLLKLKASKVELYDSEFLTAKDANSYLKKCLSDACEKDWWLRIYFEDQEFAEKIICKDLRVEETGRVDDDGIPIKLVQSQVSNSRLYLKILNYCMYVWKTEEVSEEIT